MRNFMIDIWVWTKGKQMFVNINFNKIKKGGLKLRSPFFDYGL